MDDYPVKFRSNAEVQKLAKQLRSYFNVSTTPIDVLDCLGKEKILTVSGEQRLNYVVRPDSEMGADDGITSYAKSVVTITAKKSVHEMAGFGYGRARNTLAHELGHAVMHDCARKARKTGATGKTTPKWIKPSESAEHQAKVFAAAFLIDDKVAETLQSADDIAIKFGVSYESAKIYFDGLINERDRPEAAERVARKAAAFGAPVPDPGPPKYMAERCTSCGLQTLFPSGSKFICDTCGGAVDRFQDGDPLDP